MPIPLGKGAIIATGAIIAWFKCRKNRGRRAQSNTDARNDDNTCCSSHTTSTPKNGSLVAMTTARGELVVVHPQGRSWEVRAITGPKSASQLNGGDSAPPIYPKEALFMVARENCNITFQSIGADGRPLRGVQDPGKSPCIAGHRSDAAASWQLTNTGLANCRWTEKVLQYKLVEVHCVGREAMVNAMQAHDLQMRRLRTEFRQMRSRVEDVEILRDQIGVKLSRSEAYLKQQQAQSRRIAHEKQRAEVALRKMSGRAMELQDLMASKQGREHGCLYILQDAHTREVENLREELRDAEEAALLKNGPRQLLLEGAGPSGAVPQLLLPAPEVERDLVVEDLPQERIAALEGGGSPSAYGRPGPQNHNSMQIYQPTQMTLSNCMGLQLKSDAGEDEEEEDFDDDMPSPGAVQRSHGTLAAQGAPGDIDEPCVSPWLQALQAPSPSPSPSPSATPMHVLDLGPFYALLPAQNAVEGDQPPLPSPEAGEITPPQLPPTARFLAATAATRV